ncbi:MAG: hypothetical protein LBL16_01375 [Endomicrobium sp.]|nr:hypothetical protein [Endomicrobium sp.]
MGIKIVTTGLILLMSLAGCLGDKVSRQATAKLRSGTEGLQLPCSPSDPLQICSPPANMHAPEPAPEPEPEYTREPIPFTAVDLQTKLAETEEKLQELVMVEEKLQEFARVAEDRRIAKQAEEREVPRRDQEAQRKAQEEFDRILAAQTERLRRSAEDVEADAQRKAQEDVQRRLAYEQRLARIAAKAKEKAEAWAKAYEEAQRQAQEEFDRILAQVRASKEEVEARAEAWAKAEAEAKANENPLRRELQAQYNTYKDTSSEDLLPMVDPPNKKYPLIAVELARRVLRERGLIYPITYPRRD